MLLFTYSHVSPANENKSLAIFDFVNEHGFKSEAGNKIALLIFAELAKNDQIQLLEREEMNKIVAEQRLSLRNNSSSIKAGKILGAGNILVGRIYTLDDEIYFNGKLIDCKTGKISGLMLSHKKISDPEKLYQTFAEKIAANIVKKLISPKQQKKIKDK